MEITVCVIYTAALISTVPTVKCKMLMQQIGPTRVESLASRETQSARGGRLISHACALGHARALTHSFASADHVAALTFQLFLSIVCGRVVSDRMRPVGKAHVGAGVNTILGAALSSFSS